MDTKEAIKRLKQLTKYTEVAVFIDAKDGEAFQSAIESLEKQLLKAPIDYKCPCCGESVFLETRAGWYQVEKHLKVCENCGQKIDWSKLPFKD